MKRFFQILAMAALSVSLWSCSKDAPADPIAPVQPNPQLTQLCLKGTITSMPLARVNADGFEANDKVGVYVATASTLNSAGNTLDNEAFTYSSGNIAAPQGKEVYWASDDVRFSVFAYYPYVTGAPKTGVVNFSVEADQSTSAKYYGSDFISAKSLNLAPQSSPVALTFNHLLSRLDVELVAGDGITQDELRAAEKSLLVGGLDMSGKVDIVAGTVVGDEQFGDVAPYKVDGDSYSFIAYPCDEKLSFRLEMDDELYSCSADIELKAGYKSKITITVDKYEPQTLSLSVVGINPWIDDATNYAATMDNEILDKNSNIIFTDANFKAFLVSEYLYVYNPDLEDESDDPAYEVSANKIDANDDGEISIAEAENVVYLEIDRVGVSNLSELSYFANLEGLMIYEEDNLTTIDLSHNTTLKYLEFENCGLRALDLSYNTALKSLWCTDNQIANLNVSKNTALEYLICDGNQLEELDVSHNTALKALYLDHNKLTNLDITNNTNLMYLSCDANGLSVLDVSNNTKLVEILCYENRLTRLDVSNNVSLIYLECGENQLTALDVSNNTALENLFLGGNNLSQLNVSQNEALIELSCDNNQLTALDVSKNTALIELRCNPMDDENGNNLLTTIYTYQGQTFTNLSKPDGAQLVVKPAN